MHPRATALVFTVIGTAFAAQAHASGDVAEGKAKAQACAVCHGLDGIAKQPDAPNIGGESEVYLERQLKAFRSGERVHQQMSVIAQTLSDEDIDDLVAWYAAIEVATTVPEI